MSLPRRIVPGTSYLITRTTRSRRFFLSPDDTGVAVIFWFCIAVAAAITGVAVSAVCVMSTHIHLVVTDVRGELPRFTHWLFRHSAVCLKLLRGIDENVWSSGKGDYTELRTTEALIDAIAYTLSNPTTSGLIPKAHKWPGAITSADDLRGAILVAEVPRQFFSKKWKPQSLRFSLPPALAETHTIDDAVDLIKKRVRRFERAKLAELRAHGGSFLGVDKVLKVRHTSRPTRPRPRRPGSRVPTLKTVCRAAMKEAIEGLRAFRAAYADALEAWRAGKDATFPYGTWWMARLSKARVKVAPAA
jgi:putative transposase